ncbi:oxidoreductase [Cordyceps fumosorosea ARSEF 2679]|uniref:Oxidoreductase n=1 Tax=Cordyceps fumosorosea (strain ARSEF 2679) TaxID=1081104 RepID=A0A167LIY0_CORFA|nr:oxidoreductase [Cordyceps fumosorosea ARSEF 2679]OAA53142.1 oxidoreductase [Cordyceps fumosorosea ARSEF 2679]
MDPSYDVLVTGSAGHLGTALMLALPGLGFTPYGIDVLASPTTTAVGNIADRGFIRGLLQGSRIRHVIHAATLHKPHVGSHTKAQFVETNITGTVVLLEEAAALPNHQVESFLFLSTTSAFGTALSPKPGNPAAWIDESVVPQPKNIYGVTKTAAEDMCLLVQRQTGLPVLVLRTSRFFPEEDDDDDRRNELDDANLKVLELAYRRVDLEDIVGACVCGMAKAKSIGWGRYIISAPPPFKSRDEETLKALDSDPGSVLRSMAPGVEAVFEKKGWGFLRRIDRVYDSSKAVRELGWRPKYTFEEVVRRVGEGKEWRSELTSKVGRKGYHAVSTGVYTKR